MNTLPTLSDVINAILGGVVDQHFDTIYQTLRDRQKAQQAMRAAQATLTLKPGDKVTLAGLSPKYLNGLTGEIISKQGNIFQVKLDQKLYQKRFWNQDVIHVPASTVSKSA